MRKPRWVRDFIDDFYLWMDDILVRRAAVRRLQLEHEQRLEEDYSYGLRYGYGEPVTREWEPSPEDVLRAIEQIRAEHPYIGKVFRKPPSDRRDRS